MTIESVSRIIVMLKNEGTFPGDPQMSSIYSYETITGKNIFAVFSDERFNDIWDSPYVQNAVLLWKSDIGLTIAGKEFLADHKE